MLISYPANSLLHRKPFRYDSLDLYSSAHKRLRPRDVLGFAKSKQKKATYVQEVEEPDVAAEEVEGRCSLNTS